MGLKQVLEHKQKVLELQLAIAREQYEHRGLRGESVEMAFRAFLAENLPRSQSIGTGEVIAVKGDGKMRTSSQLDIVIANHQQPFSSNRDAANVFLIESVNSAGEIKSVLSRSKFGNEMKKANRFKSLRSHNLSRLVDVPKPDTWESYYVHYRPYFIFTLESPADWRELLLDTCTFIIKENKPPYDALFLMDKGIVILISPFTKTPFSNSPGIPFEHEIPDIGKTTGGIQIYKTTALLALFLFWISIFRTTLLSDHSALPHYLEPIVNSSLEKLILASIKSELAQYLIEQAKIDKEANPLKFTADYLKCALEKKT